MSTRACETRPFVLSDISRRRPAGPRSAVSTTRVPRPRRSDFYRRFESSETVGRSRTGSVASRIQPFTATTSRFGIARSERSTVTRVRILSRERRWAWRAKIRASAFGVRRSGWLDVRAELDAPGSRRRRPPPVGDGDSIGTAPGGNSRRPGAAQRFPAVSLGNSARPNPRGRSSPRT